jgi:hypothetical protein
MRLRYGRLERQFGQGCFSTKSVGEAIWASSVPRVRPLPEEALGRDVTSSGTTVPARGWARARRDRVPWVDESLDSGGYLPCLGVLGVPLITVPDSCPRASKGVLILAWRLCRTFLRGDRPFSVILCSGGCARAHPPGVAPEASKEWFDSSEVLTPFVMPWPAWLFPRAT